MPAPPASYISSICSIWLVTSDFFLTSFVISAIDFPLKDLCGPYQATTAKGERLEPLFLRFSFVSLITRSRVALSASRFFASSRPPARSHAGRRESSEVELAVYAYRSEER